MLEQSKELGLLASRTFGDRAAFVLDSALMALFALRCERVGWRGTMRFAEQRVGWAGCKNRYHRLRYKRAIFVASAAQGRAGQGRGELPCKKAEVNSARDKSRARPLVSDRYEGGS